MKRIAQKAAKSQAHKSRQREAVVRLAIRKPCPFDELLDTLGIAHKLMPPRRPWHNGKVEDGLENGRKGSFLPDTP